jgi:hypothetical protein
MKNLTSENMSFLRPDSLLKLRRKMTLEQIAELTGLGKEAIRRRINEYKTEKVGVNISKQ